MGAYSEETPPTYYDCDDFELFGEGGAFALVSVGTVGSPAYNKTVTLASGFDTDAFYMASGKISQPATSGRDITVTENFTFVGGTLNSSSYLANVYLNSATASIAPTSEGSVTLGSNLRPLDGTDL